MSGVSRSPSYNALNQLASSVASGNQNIGFSGSLNGLDTVTVSGSTAMVSGDNFLGLAVLAPGTTGTFSVVATDAQGNSRTNHYRTTVPAQPSYSPTFDSDGNELANGAGQSYTWDVKNELIRIAQASGTSIFAYDALGHRISETDNGALTKQWVWDGNTMAEERNASNTVTKRFYAQGEQISGTNYYYTRDHLGSVREMTTGTSGTILARYDYDPYGRPTMIQGTLTSDFQYAGYYEHAASGLNLTQYRAYDPITSRWLSRDPLGEVGGINLYDYVGNDTVNRTDPKGEFWSQIAFALGVAYATFQLYSGYESAQSLLAEQQAYHDTESRMHCKYGDVLPDEIQNALDQWQREMLQNFGPQAAPLFNLPNTSTNDPLQGPIPSLNH